jgi:hypothetical protein
MFNLTHVKNKGYLNKKSSTIPVINFVNNITKDIKPFYVNDSETCLLFFDIFYKNNKVYLIMPIYNEPYTTADFTIIHNNKNLLPSEQYIKDSYEPISVFVYDIGVDIETQVENYITIDVIYKTIKQTYKLYHINTQNTTNTQKHFLTLTTLFKHDYHLFPFFYNYYTKQGVSHFYLYYNGIITPEIYTLFNQPRYKNVTLVEWNFHYWNPRKFKYFHHAQMGQIHHALYRYGKDTSEYMIFCDFDEYLHIPCSYPRSSYNLLHKYIKNNLDIDIFGFCNIWADTSQYQYPNTQIIPKKILAVAENEQNPYCERSKNIYKVSSINTIGIHQLCNDIYFLKLKSIVDLKMYHFYKWSSKTRIIENCTNVKDFEF